MKIKAIILSLSILIVSSCFPVLKSGAEDFSWADKASQNLYREGIISGDENGDFAFEKDITRAEFVKMINKKFHFYKKAVTNFKDVEKDKWFYDDFLIAKNQGYILGDENNNANPENKITREEASVILSKVLNLNPGSNENIFTDNISSWAKGYVNALTKENIIKGYPDNTFRGKSFVKRAEAFVMIDKSNLKNDEDDGVIVTPVLPGDTKPINKGGSSGGSGGGGGGGGSSAVTKLKPPHILKYDAEKEDILIKPSKNVSGYKLLIEVDNTPYTYDIISKNINTINISDKLLEITENIDKVSVEFDISLMAKGEGKYKDSSYCDKIHCIKYFKALDTPLLNLKTAKAGGIKHAVLNWENVENAKEYEVIAKSGEEDFTDYTYNKEKNEIRIADLSTIGDKDILFKIRALSDKKSDYKNSKFGEITVSDKPENKVDENGFYLVSNEEDFIYAIKNCDKVKLASGIKLGDAEAKRSWEPLQFDGELDGNNKVITIYADTDKEGTGVFENIKGDVKIYDLIIKGKIKSSKGDMGSLAGKVEYTTINSEIKNIINFADIEYTVKPGAFSIVGGIIGNMTSWNGHKGKFQNLYNFGNIEGECTYMGGICGKNRGNIENSGNYGNLSDGNKFGHVAGIVGRNYNTVKITNCFNKGNITTNFNSAGILAINHYGTVDIECCYNLGNISASETGGIASISKPDTASDAKININYCFNLGESKNPISSDNENIKISNSLYKNNNKDDDKVDGTEPLTEEEFNDKENSFIKILLENGFEKEDTMKYPTIKDNKEFIPKIYESVSNLKATETEDTIEFTWDNPLAEDISYISVIINDNTDIVKVKDENLSKEKNSFILENKESGKYYEIFITIYYEDKNCSDTVSLEVKTA